MILAVKAIENVLMMARNLSYQRYYSTSNILDSPFQTQAADANDHLEPADLKFE
jgi:hypothetical protein